MICSQKVERLVLRIQKNKVTCLLLKESTQMIARSNKSFWMDVSFIVIYLDFHSTKRAL